MMKILNLTNCVLLLLLIAALSGCDNTLDLVDENRGQYSIYGVLDMNEERNFIRIKDLKVPIDEMINEPLNLEVVLENLSEGTSEILKDSVVIFDGLPTHNFYTDMEITPESDFQLSVTDSEGRTVTASATSPNQTELTIEPNNPGCRTEIEIEISPIHNGSVISHIVVEYDNMERRMRGFERQFGDNVKQIFQPQEVLDEIWKDWGIESLICYELCYEDPRLQCWQLDSDIWKVSYTHVGPDLIAANAEFEENIEGGLGVFGIIRTEQVSFQIDSSRVIPPRELPFFCPNECPPME